MTYYNPIFCFKDEEFIEQAKACGVDGVIIPDLPPEEGSSFIKLSHKQGLDTICFLSPTSTLQRIKFIARVSRGFIYYVSLTGVTGPRESLPSDLKKNLQIIKANTSKPVCVGFGISSPSQVKELFKLADGVIVGSAIVKKIKENLGHADLVKRVSAFVRYLKNV
jgi:tryptophan synthase alpha chain